MGLILPLSRSVALDKWEKTNKQAQTSLSPSIFTEKKIGREGITLSKPDAHHMTSHNIWASPTEKKCRAA